MRYRITIEQTPTDADGVPRSDETQEVYRQTFEDVDYHELIIRLNHKPRKRTRKEKGKNA